VAVQPFVGPWPLFQFLDLLYGRYDSLDGESARRKAATCIHDSTKQHKRTETSIPEVGIELTVAVFERVTSVNALDRAATVIGMGHYQMV
jgi:hypothetical protein